MILWTNLVLIGYASLLGVHTSTGRGATFPISRIKKKSVYSTLVKTHSLMKLVYFRENSGDVAREFSLLLYGKKDNDFQSLSNNKR